MSISIPSFLVEFILLGPTDDRRQLQDSPILGDVWIAFATEPEKRHDLLIEPYKGNFAGKVAEKIDDELGKLSESEKFNYIYQDNKNEGRIGEAQNVSFLEGFVVANLTFAELILVVVPLTTWWISKKGIWQEVFEYNRKYLEAIIEEILNSAEDWHLKNKILKFQKFSPIDRFLTLTGLILWAGNYDREKKQSDISYVLEEAKKNITEISKSLAAIADQMKDNLIKDPLIWQVSRNRTVIPAISKSIPAVKADAANFLFKVDCSEIGWAVLDSGIDGDHPAFKDKDGKSRIKRSFDFRNIRRIISFSNKRKSVRQINVENILADKDKLAKEINANDTHKDLETIAGDARERASIRWELIEKYIEINTSEDPYTDHGTHVAGIIGARGDGDKHETKDAEFLTGMCPDILLYDFRVLGRTMEDTESAIIAALQYIRYLNSQDKFFTIHGANLSLSIPHDVRNFACGRTPVCEECMRLVSSGVVVVAAAGNHGYKSFETNEGAYNSYTAFSITDPGNAESVITVGSTHRYWPHTYGISFFSSRGPTGDGRMKPDLVAPGERIYSTIRSNIGDGWDVSDGTSMAAPHVSGAAAMLMARYEEFIKNPERIKKILCETATDLGRERSFQGHGMLDVLRAFQSI